MYGGTHRQVNHFVVTLYVADSERQRAITDTVSESLTTQIGLLSLRRTVESIIQRRIFNYRFFELLNIKYYNSAVLKSCAYFFSATVQRNIRVLVKN